jgi:hypothetical protein
MADYQITAITMSVGGTRSEHIGSVWTPDSQKFEVGVAILLMRNHGWTFYTVSPYGQRVPVEIVNAPVPYLRSCPDWTTVDNLLSLPRRDAQLSNASYLAFLDNLAGR